VLGAGNTAGLVPGDFLHKLFVERVVVVLKPNPVNDYIGPIIEEGFRALIQRGYFQVVYGSADEGRYLCEHPLVDEVHMTGSDKTFEAIVFGPGAEGQQRKAEGKPRLTKQVTAELGNVTPIIVVPGPWTEDEIRRQGEKLAVWLTINAGFNCLTPRLIVQQRQWAHRDALNEAIRDALARIDTRRAYYPGAHDRHAAFVREHPDAWQMGNPAGDELPWTYIPGVEPANGDDICFRSESFCGLFAETALDAGEVPEYLSEAVRFVNDRVWGTLDAVLVVHPQSLKDEAIAGAVEQSIADLRYGTVVVNTYPGMAYWMASAPWGSYPGQSIHDIQSGIGFVTNTFMLEQPVKSVVRGPFLSSPDPFALGFSRAGEFGRKLAHLQAEPSYGKLTSIVWTLMRG
jgi:acyl-CoA reductase-like NAD-dependent aldehyde dehydrogenase